MVVLEEPICHQIRVKQRLAIAPEHNGANIDALICCELLAHIWAHNIEVWMSKRNDGCTRKTKDYRTSFWSGMQTACS